jgi:hypothetical protein
MPTWGQLLREVNATPPQGGASPLDVVRRKYLALLSAHTGRNAILYTTRWTQGGGDPSVISITQDDVQAMMEVVHGLDGTVGLDLILHSPGGSPDAAEAIVNYLRSKFQDIRAIVPQAAMSAATMLACASDEIVMGKHSSLGPIDPQFIVNGPAGTFVLPAQAILDQFELAKEQCRDPQLLGAWVPILPQYGPALLVQCKNALLLAEDLVAEWLKRWMLANEDDADARSRRIAKTLADHSAFRSHGRPIHREAAKAMGLRIVDLEQDQVLQDLLLSVFHASNITFGNSIAAKIVENQVGATYLRHMNLPPQILQQMVPVPQAPPIPPAPAP